MSQRAEDLSGPDLDSAYSESLIEELNREVRWIPTLEYIIAYLPLREKEFSAKGNRFTAEVSRLIEPGGGPGKIVYIKPGFGSKKVEDGEKKDE